MKVRDTSPGRLYALSSEIGCVAINGAMAVDIPAGGQVVVLALDKKIVIDGDDAAKFVEVRWGTNTVVGSRPAPAWLSDVLAGLISIVGDDNFDINYIPAENKLYLQFSLEVTTEQIEEVNSLLERELPKDLVVEMEWADGIKYVPLPTGYKRVPYLESGGGQFIYADLPITSTSGVHVRFVQTSNSGHYYVWGFAGGSYIIIGVDGNGAPVSAGRLNHNAALPYSSTAVYEAYANYKNDSKYRIESSGEISEVTGGMLRTTANTGIFGLVKGDGSFSASARARVYLAQFTHEQEIMREMLPCLDDTGTPCMFDTVTREAFYNDGTGDFTYPGAEQAVQTLALDWDAKFYAKLTEHGVRKLYHVPKGCTMTMDEYASENGFKELVEPPMPMTGYWAPVWRETDTQLILDWVETEPPIEEELQIEDTENA